MPDSRRHATMARDATLVAAVALMAIGLIIIASARASLDKSLFESLTWREPFGRQSLFILVAVPLMFFTSRFTARAIATPRGQCLWSWVLVAAALIALAIPLVPGMTTAQRGSHRWLRVTLGGTSVNVQPSEFAKLAMVFFLAWWLSRPAMDLRKFFRGFLLAAIPIGVFVLLVGMEDFGTAVLFAAVGGLMLFVAGARFPHMGMCVLGGGAGLAWLLLKDKYRRDRFTAFLDPYADPLGAGYQPLQSLKTIASGGWIGTGLGGGVQKYGYLPESHTDFIFAVLCEETGVIGAATVMALFCMLIWLGIRSIRFAPTAFERLLAFGLTSLIGWQAVMNIAVVTVMTPTTGISLPFVSAGGSGLLTYAMIAGVLSAVAQRSHADHALLEGVEWDAREARA